MEEDPLESCTSSAAVLQRCSWLYPCKQAAACAQPQQCLLLQQWSMFMLAIIDATMLAAGATAL
jgi:hypothetical protein